jgi:hypothetical protein
LLGAGKGVIVLKMRIFSLVGIALLLSLIPLQASVPRMSENTYVLDSAKFVVIQSGSQVSVRLEDRDPEAVDTVMVDGLDIHPDSKGEYSFDMGQAIESELILSNVSAHSADPNDMLRHIASRSFTLRNLGTADAAIAQSLSATKTRIRYQTFIGSSYVSAPEACFGAYINIPGITFFNGNNRTWDADSDSYKTRFDSIITWGTNPSVKPEVSVGETIAYMGFPPLVVPTFRTTASSASMKLNATVLSPDYVSFGIKQNVPNPLCIGADGINFDLHFYVRRDGVYTVTGNYLRVPYHEVYARDNVDTSWRQIYRDGTLFFECFTPFVGNICDVNDLNQRAAF